MTDRPADTAGSSCRTRARPRPLSPDGPRPTDLLTAFFAVGIAFLVAGAATAVLHTADLIGWWGRWLALHLILLGGVSQLVLGAAQFFSTAYLATDPPSWRTARLQIGLWATGALSVALSVPLGVAAMADAGACLAVAALVVFWASLRSLERGSLQTARWAIRWYYACAVFLAVGVVLGALMARHVAWSHGSLLGAHLALNLGGWLGMAIIGTLHTFYPSLTQGRLIHERLQGPTFCAWALGVTALATGAAFDLSVLTVIGWPALTAASLMLMANVAASWRAVGDPATRTLQARLVGTAQLFLVAGMALAMFMQIREGAGAAPAGGWRAALAVLLIAGWIGMTVTGSLLHLLSVLHRVRGFGAGMPRPRPWADRVQTAAVAVSLAVLAASYAPDLADLRTPAAVLAIAATVPLVVRVLALAARAVTQRLKAA